MCYVFRWTVFSFLAAVSPFSNEMNVPPYILAPVNVKHCFFLSHTLSVDNSRIAITFDYFHAAFRFINAVGYKICLTQLNDQIYHKHCLCTFVSLAEMIFSLDYRFYLLFIQFIYDDFNKR